MASSFGQHFQDIYQSAGKKGYICAHYNVTPLCNGAIHGGNGNILKRMYNALVKAINDQHVLPKAIIIVVNDDIIDTFDHYKIGFSQAIGCIIEWLGNQLHHVITSYKEKLPSKARKFKFPTLLWTEIPQHEMYVHYNDFKQKYNRAIDRMASLFREMEVLHLKTWNFGELSYFSEGRINGNGLSTYWQAVDEAFEQWDRAQMRKSLTVVSPSANSSAEPPKQDPSYQPWTWNSKVQSKSFHCHHLAAYENITGTRLIGDSNYLHQVVAFDLKSILLGKL